MEAKRFLIVCLMVVACGEGDLVDPGPPYRAHVVSFVRGDPKKLFELHEQALPTMTSLKTLSGQEMKIDPGVLAKIDGPGCKVALGGGDHHLRYRLEDGVIIPRDHKTLMVLSLYHNFERVFADFQSISGRTIQQMLEGFGLSSFRILFEPLIQGPRGLGQARIAAADNAFFTIDPVTWATFPYGGSFLVDSAADYLTLAHEFGHMVFHGTFYRFAKTDDDTGRYGKEYAISGINEGFADFTAYIMTGETDNFGSRFIKSKDARKKLKDRDFANQLFSYADLKSDSSCEGGFYCIGTIFARSLLQFEQRSAATFQDKYQGANLYKQLLAALESTRSTIDSFSADAMPPFDEKPEPKCDLAEIFSSHTKDWEYDGKVIGGFLRGLILNFPEEARGLLCDVLYDPLNFGTDGFPADARKGVCPL